MKPADQIHNLFEDSKITVGSEVDERILNDSLKALRFPPHQSGTLIWSLIMRNPITKIAAAVMIVLTVLWLTFPESTLPQAYAIEQTIRAMDAIQSVHFKMELFKQGSVECWMMFDENHVKPTHVCLFSPESPIRKIDSPEGCFGYNTATNRYRENLRDERKMDWYPDFRNFFKNALGEAQDDESMTISEQYDESLNLDVIVIDIQDADRHCEYLIDPESKLPIRFSTFEIANFMKFYRQTIAVRNISFIEYNQPAPAGLFDIPDDAELVINEHDLYVYPDAGIAIGSLTHEQACEKIVQEVTKAMNDRDWERVSKLMFPFGPPPKEMEARIPADPSQPLVEILEMGRSYKQGDYWYIPVKSRETGGKLKNEQVPVKFYEFDGIQYCMIMWPD